MYNFLFFSFLSGIIELGIVYIGIKQELPLVLIMALPLFYQLGNLMMNYIERKRRLLIAICVLMIVLSLFNSKSWCYPVFAVQIAICSFYIQSMREMYKKQCPTWQKRIFRIFGFAASPLMLITNGQLVLMIISGFSAIFFAMNSVDFFESLTPKKVPKEISLVMIFHQIHYFVYTYIMPLYVFHITDNYLISAVVFAGTWIIYLMPQVIAQRAGKIKYKTVFFMCHLFLAFCLGVMSLCSIYNNRCIILVMWLLTGLGGGSVFCIKYLSERYRTIDMDLSENIGHVLGPAAAMIICALTPGKEITYLTLASFICVLLAIIIGGLIQRKEAKQ